MIAKGTNSTEDVYNGTTEIEKVYKGTSLRYKNWVTKQGVPPITLNKCRNANIKDYQIYGNSVQNGTPTPSNPVEIQSVGDNETGLPLGYTKLAYIEATGTQYIDTGFSPDGNTQVDYKVKTTSGVFDASPFVGARLGSSNANRFFPISYMNVENQCRSTFGTVNIFIDITGDTMFEGSFQPKNNASIINGTSYDISNAGFQKSANNNLYLFATSGYPNNLYLSHGKMYYCKIYDNGTLIRNYIPCKNSSNVIGLYDTVNNVFYTNQGTGDFVGGSEVEKGGYKIPVTVTNSNNEITTTNIYLAEPLRKLGNTDVVKLPDGYTQLEYIESTGTQYIDTHITATNNTGMKIKYMYTANGPSAISGIFKSATPRQDTLLISTNSGTTNTGTYTAFVGHRGYTSSSAGLSNVALNTDYEVKINYLNDGEIYFNNVDIGNVGNNDVYDATILIFARFSVGSSSISISNSRIYYAEFTEGNKISHKLIPCKNSFGVVGMYDVITGTFLTNAGTNDFVPGNTIFADYIDYNSQKVIRNVSELIVTGYEDDWQFVTSSGANIARLTVSNEQLIPTSISSEDELCNYFPCKSITTGNNIKGASVYYSSTLTKTYFRARYDNLTNLSTSKAFFKELYDAGTPVKIYYQSFTPTEESIELPNVLLNKGTNIIDVDTDITPSNMWIKYKGKE